jgi:hypothetical protein
MATAVDQLHDTREAGRLLGGLHPRDVLRLIHAKRLRAKAQTVRGENKRPRLYVPASAIAEYIESLPDADGEPAAPQSPAKRRTPRGVRAELANVKAYY